MNSVIRLIVICVLVFTGASGLKAQGMSPNTPELSTIDSLDKKVSLDFVDASLKDVLKLFTQQTGVNFVVQNNLSLRPISIFLQKVTVRQALKSIAKANDLQFTPIEGTAVFKVSSMVASESDTRITKVYKLKYAKVVDLFLIPTDSNTTTAEEIRDIDTVLAGVGGGIADEEISNLDPTNQGVVNAIATVLSSDGVLSFDVRTNSIIVTDQPERIERVDVIIEALDQRLRQVLIKSEILELTDTLNNLLGLRYGNAAGQVFDFTYDPPTINFLGFPFNQSFLGLDEFINEAEIAAQRAAADGITFGQLNPGQFQVALNALKTSGKAKFLSRPRVLTMENESAIVDITSNTAINQSITVDESGISQTSFEREPTGILLRVTPQINDNKEVTMLIQPSVTRIGQSSLFDTALDPFTRSVLTKVRVPEGDTISIGGLLQEDVQKTANKLPILGDIPIIGSIFSEKSKVISETDLIVFITPYIIDNHNISFLQKHEDHDSQSDAELWNKKDMAQKELSPAKGLEPKLPTSTQREGRSQAAVYSKIDEYERLAEERPEDPLVHSNLGVAYSKVQKYDLAIDEFKKAILLDPSSSTAYNNLGNLYRIKREYGAAISSLKRAVEIAPDHPYAYTTLGLCYEMKDMYDEAQKSYANAIKFAPNEPWTNTARQRLNILRAR